MTRLLEKGFQEAAKRSAGERDALARALFDEVEDYRELHDSKVQREIQKGNEEYLAGKSRPFEEFLAELKSGRGKNTKSRRQQRP